MFTFIPEKPVDNGTKQQKRGCGNPNQGAGIANF